MASAKTPSMPNLTVPERETEPKTEGRPGASAAAQPTCYSIAIFTQRWRDIRDFYIDLLGARIVSEKENVYCEMEIGGVPLCLRQCQNGEVVSYFHLYLALPERDGVLNELRRRGIVVTTVGPYTNFRDPEGRVIKLSEAPTIVA